MFLSSFDISGYGLSAQRFRIETISANIANAQTTRTDEGGAYKRRSVIFKATDFQAELNRQIESQSLFHKYENPLDEQMGLEKSAKPPIMSVVVDKVVRDDSPFKLKYDPTHPDANKDGYVAYPNINPVVEMSDLVEATRSYQANAAAFQSAKGMASNAIDMMRT